MQTFAHGKIFQSINLAFVAFGLVLLLGPTTEPALAQTSPSLMFIENVGQFPAAGGAIRFQARSGQATLSLTDSALWFTIFEEPTDQPQAQSVTGQDDDPQAPLPIPQKGVNLKLSFPNANPQPGVEPFDRLDTHVSFFVGNDPANWHSDVPVWGGVRYIDLYPGVDLEVTGENGRLVQRWVIKEDVSAQSSGDTDPLSNIQWEIEGADALNLESADQLRLSTPVGDFNLPLPQIVTTDGALVDLSTIPEVNGLEVTAPFSLSPLPPDSPARIAAAADLLFSTYLGGGVSEDGQAIAVDGAGGVYVTGLTSSADFPTTPGTFDPNLSGFFDTYVAKLNPLGTALDYAAYLGGDGGELTYGLAVDEAGDAYVTGYTRSPDFPITPGAYDTSIDGLTDAFVIKINPTGTGLIYSTFVGGSYLEWGFDLALDGTGSVYVSGLTTSADFPTTPGAFQPGPAGDPGFRDGIVFKLNPSGTALEYSTYLGGNGWDEAWAIAVDTAGNAYITGQTDSTNFPVTPGAFQTDFHRAFVVKLNPTGTGLGYGTYLGGSGVDMGWSIAVDQAGHAYVAGDTTSSNFPTTPGAFQTTYHTGSSVTREGDAFVVKLNPAGSGLVYGTFLGGSDHDNGFDIAVNSSGQAYVTGPTISADFPTTPDSFQPTRSGYPDAYVARLNAAGSGLVYGTFLGGNGGETGFAIAADNAGNAYVTGGTSSADFPTSPGAFDTTYDGTWSDAFITKLATGNQPEPPPPSPVPAHTCAPTPLGTVSVGDQPRGLALDSVRQRLYVANFAGNSVSVVNTNSNSLIQTIAGINAATGVAFDPSHNLIWVSNYSTNQLTPIQVNSDATGFTPLPAVITGSGPWGVAYDPIHDYVYVANSLANSVTVVNAASHTVVTTLTGSFNQPFHLAPNPVTGKIYVSNFGNNSVTVLEGTAISRVVQLWDSGRPYGIAVDETRNLIYVATIETHRIVVIGPIRGVPDQFYGWAAFHRGFGNPNRPVPLRMVAINPAIGPSGDGGHVWATTATTDGSETNQALFIPKGWGGYFHFPFAQNVGNHPTDGLAIDRVTNRVYISSGTSPGTVTVVGDHATLCADAYAHIASLEEGTPPAEDADQIGVEIFESDQETSQPSGDVNGDGVVNILDLALVASLYGSSDATGDLNADGQVNILDLAIIADNYSQ